MPHDVIRLPQHDRALSLGWLAIEWIEALTIHGSGDIAGEPVTLVDEYAAFVVDLYALEQDGSRLYDAGFLSRPKGCAKSEVAALIGLFDCLGPSRFDRWAEGGEVFVCPFGTGFTYTYSPGDPIGKRVNSPEVRCCATEEDQSGLVYDTMYVNCTDGPLAAAMDHKDSAGLTRILLPGGGEIKPSTASSSSKDGGKETLVIFDESHLYNRPELKQMHKTLVRNLRKRRKSAGTFYLETTTMYNPGEESVAEDTYQVVEDYRLGKLKKPTRTLLDHRYGDITPDDLEDEEKIRAALKDSYGDCAAWNDIDGYVDAILDPRTDVADSFRYWFNARHSAEGAWIVKYQWDSCGPEVQPIKPVSEKDVIVLGFDGSRKRRRGVTDSTAVVACRVSDGLVWPIKIWEQDPGQFYKEGWEVPEHDVQAAVQRAFRDYRVVGFYADPAKWETVVAGWEAKYGPHLKVKSTASHPIEWWMTGDRAYKSVKALEEFENAVLDQQMRHTGDLQLSAHILNARRRSTTKGIQIMKEKPDSPHKIDAAVAATLAWQCRLDAVAKGIGLPRKPRAVVRVR
ncbi:hypothetical protein ACFRAQ_35040 [Nocardia sp. NPDC056611]|uniref:hypothetical protein n=1 Tax=Nocardia sp. NPDC056611 TaxID=3345877 RepID=UPI00366F3FA6